MTIGNSEAAVELLPGYRVDSSTGAWSTLPWPTDMGAKEALLASSLGPAVIAWAEGRTDEPGLTDYLTGRPWRFTPGPETVPDPLLRRPAQWPLAVPLRRQAWGEGHREGPAGRGVVSVRAARSGAVRRLG